MLAVVSRMRTSVRFVVALTIVLVLPLLAGCGAHHQAKSPVACPAHPTSAQVRACIRNVTGLAGTPTF